MVGDLEDKGVASIATSSSSSSGTISKHLFSSVVSSSATLAYSCSTNFCFLALSCFSSCPVLLELPLVTSACVFFRISSTFSVFISTKLSSQLLTFLPPLHQVKFDLSFLKASQVLASLLCLYPLMKRQLVYLLELVFRRQYL
uniref:Uncharacterized protein n=1 Tax=Tanacetum cinerariifolium TaxID=118510 RepID=A0A699QXH8_TANCI|nr:hypothetical protein [Tanacetum cinerariifolium]